MNLLVPFLLLVIAVCCGCKKKEAVPPVAGGQAAPEPAAESVSAEPTPAVATVPPSAKPAKPLPPAPVYVTARADNNLRENVIGVPNVFLSQQLRVFVQKNGRLPDSFAEFANTTLDSIQRPPEGTKWVIDTASLQVKAVSVNSR